MDCSINDDFLYGCCFCEARDPLTAPTFLSAQVYITSATRERWREGGGVHTKEPMKVGWVHGCQPIRDKSPFTSKPALCRYSPTAVSVCNKQTVSTH